MKTQPLILDRLPAWLQNMVASMGGLGLFVVAFLDSSILSFPIINDLLVIHLSARNPAAMPYYALMATAGSLAGSVWLYYLAKKGGEALFRRRVGRRAERVRDWVQRNGFLSIAIPSILPPPMPFKAFVLAAGVFQMPMKTFVIALAIGRGLRYFGEGVLAVRYGPGAIHYIRENRLEVGLLIVALIGFTWLLSRWMLREPPKPA